VLEGYVCISIYVVKVKMAPTTAILFSGSGAFFIFFPPSRSGTITWGRLGGDG